MLFECHKNLNSLAGLVSFLLLSLCYWQVSLKAKLRFTTLTRRFQTAGGANSKKTTCGEVLSVWESYFGWEINNNIFYKYLLTTVGVISPLNTTLSTCLQCCSTKQQHAALRWSLIPVRPLFLVGVVASISFVRH